MSWFKRLAQWFILIITQDACNKIAQLEARIELLESGNLLSAGPVEIAGYDYGELGEMYQIKSNDELVIRREL